MSGKRPPDSSQSSLWAKAKISPTELHTKLLIYRLAAEENLVVLKDEDCEDQDTQKATSSAVEKTAEWLEKINPHVQNTKGDFTPPDLIPIEKPVSPDETASQAPDEEDREHEWDIDPTVDKPIWEDSPQSNQTDHGSTITTETLLVETFLDRVAEFVSPNHGANHVTSAAIAGLRTERPRLVFTKNTAFTKESQAFLTSDFAESLRQVADAKGQGQVRALKKTRMSLYENVCEYSQKRIRHHAAKLSQKWGLHEASLSPVGEKVTKLLRDSCQKCQPDHLTTPDLVMAAYELTLNVPIKKLLKLDDTNHIDQVLRHLWFCARPRRAFVAFQELCYAIPELRNLVIECLNHVDPDMQKPSVWSLDQCKAFLGQQAEAKQFEGLNKDLEAAPKRKLFAHCEIRLVFATGMPCPEFFNYIGGSKRPCWLCHLWLKSMGTCSKESHAQLYGWWTFPSLPKYGPNQDAAGLERLISATRTFSATILGFLDNVIPRLTEANSMLSKLPHSSLGETRMGLTQKGRPQRLIIEDLDRWSQAFSWNRDLHEAFHECCKTNLRKPAYCQSGCERLTSRECSSCGEGFFCSEDHEGAHKRPLGRFNSHHIIDCVPKLKSHMMEIERNSSSQPTSCFVCDALKAYPCRGCFSIFFCSAECYFDNPDFHINSCEEFSRTRHSHDSGLGTEMYVSGFYNEENHKVKWTKVPEAKFTSISKWTRNLPRKFVLCRVRRVLIDESIEDRLLAIVHYGKRFSFGLFKHLHSHTDYDEVLKVSQLGEWQILNLSIQEYERFRGISPWNERRAAGTEGFIIPGSSILRSVKVNSVLDQRRAGGIMFANEHTYCNGNRKSRFSIGARALHSQIARKIGYPILIWSPFPNPIMEQEPQGERIRRMVLGLLLLDVDPSSPTWGQPTFSDSFFDKGSFWILAEDDSFPINARLVERIWGFCVFIWTQVTEEVLSKAEVNEMLTRTKFDEFMAFYDRGLEVMELPGLSEPTLDDSAHAEPGRFVITDKCINDEAARLAEEGIKMSHWLTDEKAG